MEIDEAEKWLADSRAPKVQTPSNTEVDQWSQFKPQQNLEPIHLEQGVTHLEVTKFVEAMRTYITLGLQGSHTCQGSLDVCSTVSGIELVGIIEGERCPRKIIGGHPQGPKGRKLASLPSAPEKD